LIVSPPPGHRNRLHGVEEKEQQQLVQIIPRIKRRAEDVVVAGPDLVVVAIRPVHDDEPADDGRQVAGADVAVEIREGAEEDGAVPQVELERWEAAGEEVQDGGCAGAQEEAVWERTVYLLPEEFSRALDTC
jgi:hypothetical protein